MTTVIPEWTLADHLRKARQTSGMNQRDFAARLQVTAGAYAQWEAGNSRPRDVVSIAKRIEALTNIPAAWTLGVELPRLDSNQQPSGYRNAQLRQVRIRRHRPRHMRAVA